MTVTYTGKLGDWVEKAKQRSELDVDYIMSHLSKNSSLAMTRYVDYALSHVATHDWY